MLRIKLSNYFISENIKGIDSIFYPLAEITDEEESKCIKILELPEIPFENGFEFSYGYDVMNKSFVLVRTKIPLDASSEIRSQIAEMKQMIAELGLQVGENL